MRRLRFAVLATGIALAAAVLVAAPASATVAAAAPAHHNITALQPPGPGPGPGPNCYFRQAQTWGGYAQWRTCRDRGYVTVQGFVQDTRWDNRCATVVTRFDNGQQYWARACQPGYRQGFYFQGWGWDAWTSLYDQ